MTTRFEKLVEPAQTGSVQTRSRILKTGASMCYWHSEHSHMTTRSDPNYVTGPSINVDSGRSK